MSQPTDGELPKRVEEKLVHEAWSDAECHDWLVSCGVIVLLSFFFCETWLNRRVSFGCVGTSVMAGAAYRAVSVT